MQVLIMTLFVIVCILLIIIVLLQKGRGGGLSAAFGGMGSSAFGTRTGDVFTWVTIVLVGVFLLLAIGSAKSFTPPRSKLPPPSFVPLPGPISGDEMIMLQSGSGADIYYTIDGSEPTNKAHKYEVPFQIKPGTAVKAYAVMAEYDQSEVGVGTYPYGVTSRPAASRPARTTTRPASGASTMAESLPARATAPAAP